MERERTNGRNVQNGAQSRREKAVQLPRPVEHNVLEGVVLGGLRQTRLQAPSDGSSSWRWSRMISETSSGTQ